MQTRLLGAMFAVLMTSSGVDAGYYPAIVSFVEEQTDISTGDFNDDGHADAITIGPDFNDANVWIGGPNGVWHDTPSIPSGRDRATSPSVTLTWTGSSISPSSARRRRT